MVICLNDQVPYENRTILGGFLLFLFCFHYYNHSFIQNEQNDTRLYFHSYPSFITVIARPSYVSFLMRQAISIPRIYEEGNRRRKQWNLSYVCIWWPLNWPSIADCAFFPCAWRSCGFWFPRLVHSNEGVCVKVRHFNAITEQIRRPSID